MTIKIVDAAKIRNTIDTDFGGAGSHADYPYIPLGEYWLDKFLRDEKPLFTALFRLEQRMRGKSFRHIRETAKKTLTTPKKGRVTVVKTAKRGPLKIIYVDGLTVRKNLDPYFLLGGHDLIYPYIPKKEIWIDTRMDAKEWKYTLIRVLHERELMAKGMSQDDAHDFALAAERMARRKDGVAEFIRG